MIQANQIVKGAKLYDDLPQSLKSCQTTKKIAKKLQQYFIEKILKATSRIKSCFSISHYFSKH